VGGDLLDRVLPVLGGVTDVVGWRIDQLREPVAQFADRLGGLIDAQGGLGQPGHRLIRRQVELVDVVWMLNEDDRVGCLAGGALDLLVAVVTDQQDRQPLPGEPLGLVVHLGHQRAGRINGAQPACVGLLPHRGGDAMGREDHQGAGRDLIEFVDEDGSLGLESFDHMPVVNDLFAHVDRRPELLQSALNRDHRPVNTCAVATRRGYRNALGGSLGTLVSHIDKPREVVQRRYRCSRPSTAVRAAQQG